MKIKFKTATGFIEAMGAFKSDFQAGPDETIVDFDGAVEKDIFYKKVDISQLPNVVIISKTQAEKDAYDVPAKRIKELMLKPVLTLPEVTEILKLRGIA